MANFYLYFVNRINAKPRLKSLLKKANKLLPLLVFFLYACTLIYAINYLQDHFMKMVIVPFVCFLVTSAFRKIISRKRPFTIYDYKPIGDIKHDRESFPSRHATSAFVIGFSILPYVPTMGIVITVIAVVISIFRVICGIHYISDVLGGLAVAFMFAYVIF
ncbi:MAG: phosphatase PAP2 family protein [Erysipelotrichaceae bacterium]|nr:phosphatase PAP2 family protein [Erysipelotrichaceae bacterium]MDD3809037.1 phosphatase PAP2 family protein [Erysipelotrichaceae bacterium]